MLEYDAIIIGSGFGGALAAHPLVHAGWRVLMIERGGWLARGPENWHAEAVRDLSAQYDCSTPYRVAGDDPGDIGSVHCVGGASVFFGGVALRYREADFVATSAERQVGALWPYPYGELEPYYAAAEHIMGVAGATGSDPTEPARSANFPNRLPPLSRISRRLSDAAERIGYHPSRLPLAINYLAQDARKACVHCSTCDCYPCAIGAKNDMASAVLPSLLRAGLELVTEIAVTGIRLAGARAREVDGIDLRQGARVQYAARHVIFAAGALATPHLLLASGCDQRHSSGRLIGKFLMRHTNAVVFGVFPDRLDPAREFHKQIMINDCYFGHSSIVEPTGRLGTIQQVHCPPIGLVRAGLPRPFAQLGTRMLGRMTGLIVIANDEPQPANATSLSGATNQLGMPAARVHHRYAARDLAARAALVKVAKAVLAEAGALLTFALPVRTFSHALGSVRSGASGQLAPVTADGRLRGFQNIWIADASVLPTSAAVNPSLTIAATALRTGCLLAGVAPSHVAAARGINREGIQYA